MESLNTDAAIRPAYPPVIGSAVQAVDVGGVDEVEGLRAAVAYFGMVAERVAEAVDFVDVVGWVVAVAGVAGDGPGGRFCSREEGAVVGLCVGCRIGDCCVGWESGCHGCLDGERDHC